MAREHMKDALQLANTGLDALASFKPCSPPAPSSHSTAAPELLCDTIQISLSVLDVLHRCQLLKGAPLQLERLWYTFSQRTLACGLPTRAAGYANHLLLKLAQRDLSSLDVASSFEDYAPLPDDSSPRVSLSACAFILFLKSLAETSPQKVWASSGACWALALQWIRKVDEPSKMTACSVEYATLMTSVMGKCASSTKGKEAIPVFLRPHAWGCVLFHLLQGAYHQAFELIKERAGLESLFESPNDVFFTALAKRVEELRKTWSPTGTVDARNQCLGWSELLISYARTIFSRLATEKRADRFLPFAMEAAGTACLLRVQHLNDEEGARQVLEELEEVPGVDVVCLASKYYNIGVALYQSGASMPYFVACCRLLRSRLQRDNVLPPNFAEKHRILSTSAEAASRIDVAFEAACWSFWVDQTR